MKKYKLGFNLSEVLICVVIMGIIAALSVQTLKIIKASYASLAYFEYNSMRQIAGEMIAGRGPSDTSNLQTIRFDNNLNKYVITDDNSIFCRALFNLVNSSGKMDCDNFAAVTQDATSEDPIILINKNNQNISPNFITANGRRYYISAHQAAGEQTIYGYRIIAVDLNGTKTPNISIREDNKIPDIISFMILDNGEVLPVGVAADNLQDNQINDRWIIYLNSKVKGYYYNQYKKDNNTVLNYDQFRDTSSIPPECKIGDKQTCNYGVVNIPKMSTTQSKTSIYSFREAYCTAFGNTHSAYQKYCHDLNLRNENCPPSNSATRFDLCTVENIKPMFRYNFN